MTSGSLVSITNVREIVQDPYGFIWIATQDGLYRYDSRHTEEYNTNFSRDKEIISPDVRSLMIDPEQGKIWFVTSGGGLNMADLKTGNVEFKTIIEYKNQAVFFTRLCNYKSRIFIGSNKGLFIIDKKTKKVEHSDDRDIFTVDQINIIKDKLVACTRRSGILLYSISEKKITRGSIQHLLGATEEIRFYNIVQRDSLLYAATSKGIIKMVVERDQIKIDKQAFSFLPLKYNSVAFGIGIDKENRIWFSNENDLIKINEQERSFKIITNAVDKNDPGWLKSIYNITLDNENNIWLGCQQGLAYLRNADISIQTFSRSVDNSVSIKHAYYLFPLNDSIVYACAENGLYNVNIKNNNIAPIDESRSYDYVFSDNNTGTIVSNSEGMFLLNQKRLTTLSQVYSEFKEIGVVRINSSIKLNDSCFALGTENHKGIIVWDFRNHQIKNYHSLNSDFKEDIVNNIIPLSVNKIAVLGDSYFNIFNITTKQNSIVAINNHEKKSYTLFFDMCRIKNKYYLASYGKGIIVLDTMFNKIEEISVQNGLSNNGVYKTLPWRDSLLFVTTNNGLNCINTGNKKILQFYEPDGLQSNAFEETSGNIYRSMLLAGGKNGFSVIKPEYMVQNSLTPVVYFGKISIELSDNKRIDTFDLESKKYFIQNNALQTTVYFSGINFSGSERTVFAYRVTEKSDAWINLSDQNFISLIGQRPGTYHLQVKAANEDGIWSEPKELILIFEPKWYQTWGFYLLIALTIAAILYALYRYRITQIKKQHEIRKNIATDLHDDLGSTLNSVKVFTNLAISGVKQEESLQQVKDNLTEATMSLRDMIWVLDDSLDTVDELITRLKQFAIPVAAASNIETTIKADSDVNSRQLTKEEKRNLFLICKEAINNSIKYSGATQIEVAVTASGKKIQIVVADNGKGFNVEEVKKGYGLKNMQYRAGQIRFKVTLTSMLDKGTQITLQPV